MSHATGLLKFPDREVYLFGEYSGTADLMCPQFYEDPEAPLDHWRSCEWPTCPHDPSTYVDVEVFTNSGHSFWWKAKACPVCNLLMTNHAPFSDNCTQVKREDFPAWCIGWVRREDGGTL